ncbi:HAD-IA family hydrolase [Cytobacillus solani]|uniref:HAD family hydrolase n=1 Tax=Cytobacillus solani TaxID=1637975 RepID=A0A0Q3T937_9BACI|nr:HAD-IA family hydrolase [Cytobacillus solani]KOP82897.1 HAD family hydrolase [Bacillus sp. FJAT-21945]KQL19917.1 HAD family hydrolase [Cytobacillus solani]USK53161.1 HAD-IA family hydrolase [Cytobacillus solani]
MLKYVIFDFDGTIADSRVVFVSAWNEIAEKYHFKKMKLAELENMKKLTIRERCKMLDFPMYKIPIFIPQLYKLYRQSINDLLLYDGMKDVLNELNKKGYKTAIISSNSEENIKLFLRRNSIENVTDILCSSHIFGKDKLLSKFLKQKQLDTTEVIYVGDEQRDIIACKKAGIKIIWVTWGYDSIEVVQSEEPDYKASLPGEIMQLI